MVEWGIIVVLLALVPQVPALPMAIDPSDTCSDSLHQFLSRIKTHVNQSDFQLHMTIPLVSPSMESLCQTSNYSLELWRVINGTKASRPKHFGTKDYFSKYQNCERPDPDLLWKHGQSVLVNPTAAAAAGGEEGELIMFQHVLAREYVIRICSCLEGDDCSCLTNERHENSSVVCSEVINVNQQVTSNLVFNWCKEGEHDKTSPQANFLTPVIQHCPSIIKLQGTLPSCTPVRHYDTVEIVLQPFPKGKGRPDCGRHSEDGLYKKRRPGLNNKMVHRAQLESMNQTHGTFSAEITNVSLDTYYCLIVELANNPYCRKSMADGVMSDSQTFTVCRPIAVSKPILMEAHTCPQDTKPCQDHTDLPIIIGSGCGVAVCIVIVLIVACRFCRKRSPSSGNDLAISDKLLSSPPRVHHPDILFLYFADCTEFVDVNSLLGHWMVGLGHKVIDLADNSVQEEMAGSPEVWLTDRIEDPAVKVVVVKSKAADMCLESEGGEGGVLMARLDRPRDAMDPLRVFSLRQIQARLTGNYRRLAVLQCWEGGEGATMQLVPHTRHVIPDHLPELQAWLADTASYDGNDNVGGGREQTLKDLKAAVYKYYKSEMTTSQAKL